MIKLKRICFVLLVMTFIVGLFYFFTDSHFCISRLTYDKTNFISQEDLDKIFSPLDNRNVLIALIRYRHYKTKALETYPQIATIKFHLSLSKELSIHAEEKIPFYLFQNPDSQFLVAEDGTILSIAPFVIQAQVPSINAELASPNTALAPTQNNNVVIIKGLLPEHIEKQNINSKFLAVIRTIIDKLSTQLPGQKFQLQFLAPNNVILYKDNNLLIKLGVIEELDKKVENLKNFLNNLNPDQIKALQYIDLRLPNKVVARYRTIQQNGGSNENK